MAIKLEMYVAKHTDGEGFDIVYDTVGSTTLDASFEAVRRYQGDAVSCLGWGTHTAIEDRSAPGKIVVDIAE